MRSNLSHLAVLCDFDGTVLNIDTSVLILQKFAKSDWKIFDEQLERGEISLEECLQKQFSTVRVSKLVALREIENVASFRPNFEKLVEFCKEHGIPIYVISAGLDFVIKHFLERKGWQEMLRVYAPKVMFTVKGVKFTFPKIIGRTSENFKDDVVRQYKKQGKNVIYIGDGLSDYAAAKNADYSFAIKGSKLAELLKKEGIHHKEISDFKEVIEQIKSVTSFTEPL